MSTAWKIVLIVLAALIALVIIGLQIIGGFMRMNDRKIAKYFKDAPAQPHFSTYEFDGRCMSMASVGDHRNPLVLFVHGSPGSWDGYASYFKDTALLHRAQMISMDRPGYEKKGKGKVEPSMERQAAAIGKILEKVDFGIPVILVGHSLGGPVVSRAAMDFPERIDGVVIVAGSIDPEQERVKTIQKIGKFPLIRWMVPKALDVCNMEILPLKKELEAMLPFWKNIKQDVIFIQGEKDNLVPPDNADFAEEQLVNANLEVIRLPEGDHFILWSEQVLITEQIIKLVDKYEAMMEREFE